MYISYVEMCGFRGHRYAVRRHLRPHTNVLCGPNGSGKTTILDAIRFVLDPELGSADSVKSMKYAMPLNDPCYVTLKIDNSSRRTVTFPLHMKIFTITRTFESLQEVKIKGRRLEYAMDIVKFHNLLVESSLILYCRGQSLLHFNHAKLEEFGNLSSKALWIMSSEVLRLRTNIMDAVGPINFRRENSLRIYKAESIYVQNEIDRLTDECKTYLNFRETQMAWTKSFEANNRELLHKEKETSSSQITANQQLLACEHKIRDINFDLVINCLRTKNLCYESVPDSVNSVQTLHLTLANQQTYFERQRYNLQSCFNSDDVAIELSATLNITYNQMESLNSSEHHNDAVKIFIEEQINKNVTKINLLRKYGKPSDVASYVSNMTVYRNKAVNTHKVLTKSSEVTKKKRSQLGENINRCIKDRKNINSLIQKEISKYEQKTVSDIEELQRNVNPISFCIEKINTEDNLLNAIVELEEKITVAKEILDSIKTIEKVLIDNPEISADYVGPIFELIEPIGSEIEELQPDGIIDLLTTHIVKRTSTISAILGVIKEKRLSGDVKLLSMDNMSRQNFPDPEWLENPNNIRFVDCVQFKVAQLKHLFSQIFIVDNLDSSVNSSRSEDHILIARDGKWFCDGLFGYSPAVTTRLGKVLKQLKTFRALVQESHHCKTVIQSNLTNLHIADSERNENSFDELNTFIENRLSMRQNLMQQIIQMQSEVFKLNEELLSTQAMLQKTNVYRQILEKSVTVYESDTFNLPNIDGSHSLRQLIQSDDDLPRDFETEFRLQSMRNKIQAKLGAIVALHLFDVSGELQSCIENKLELTLIDKQLEFVAMHSKRLQNKFDEYSAKSKRMLNDKTIIERTRLDLADKIPVIDNLLDFLREHIEAAMGNEISVSTPDAVLHNSQIENVIDAKTYDANLKKLDFYEVISKLELNLENSLTFNEKLAATYSRSVLKKLERISEKLSKVDIPSGPYNRLHMKLALVRSVEDCTEFFDDENPDEEMYFSTKAVKGVELAIVEANEQTNTVMRHFQTGNVRKLVTLLYILSLCQTMNIPFILIDNFEQINADWHELLFKIGGDKCQFILAQLQSN